MFFRLILKDYEYSLLMRSRCITSPERVFELSEFGDDLVNMFMQI